MCFYKANVRTESKLKAYGIEIPFQGFMIRRCVGLQYWYRWGKYCFDIRPLIVYLELPSLNCHYKPWEEWFFKRYIQVIITAIGNRDFKSIILELKSIQEKKEEEELAARRLLQPDYPGDDLPF